MCPVHSPLLLCRMATFPYVFFFVAIPLEASVSLLYSVSAQNEK